MRSKNPSGNDRGVPRRAVVYARISSDRSGEQLGVARQQRDCEALAEQLGWTVAEVLVDNDISASTGKRRPSYEKLIEGLQRGTYDAVICWHPDRLYRRTLELERLIDAVEQCRAQVATVRAGHIDLTTPSGRLVARQLAVVARYEVEHASEKIKAKHRELAERGAPHGGHRPFGWERDQRTPNEAEQKVLRELVDRALAGTPVRVLTRWLNEQGVPTPQGADEWKHQSVRRMLLSPRLAGLRVSNGVVVGEAAWDPVVTLDEHTRLKALLSPRRTPAAPRVSFLAGLIWCGRCGEGKLQGGRQRRSNGTVRRFNCGACESNGILAEPVEQLVVEQIARLCDVPHFVLDPGTDDSVADVLAIEAEIERIGEALGNGDISIEVAAAAERRARERLAIARSKVTASTPLYALRQGSGADLLARWPEMALDEQARIVRSWIARIEVAPVTKRQNKLDLGRVTITWRDEVAPLVRAADPERIHPWIANRNRA